MSSESLLNDALRDLAPLRGQALWRSVEELAGSPELQAFLEAEFPEAARAQGPDRRRFLTLMGASLALGGLAGCDDQSRYGAPLLSQPRMTPGHTPGEPLQFATSFELAGYGRGVLARAHDGRPVKIEGNPLHPGSLGATDVFMQAEVLGLYDPDRAASPRAAGALRSWADARAHIDRLGRELRTRGGEGLHIVMEPSASPSLARVREAAIRAWPRARWYADDALHANAGAGARLAFGRPLDVVCDFTRADVVLSLGVGFLDPGPMQVRYAADFARRRREGAQRSRLIAVETIPGLTGARADTRLALPPHAFEPLLRAVAAALGVGEAGAETHPQAQSIVAALRAAGAGALVFVGAEQPPRIHALAHAIHAALGSVGSSLRLIEPVLDTRDMQNLPALAQALEGGEVAQLVTLGANPVYQAPADLDLARLIAAAPASLHLGSHVDETALVSRWSLPARHVLESWGDARAFDGTAGLVQPASMPRIEALSPLELLSALAGGPWEGRSIVQGRWREAMGARFEELWATALEDGVVADSAAPSVDARLAADWDAQRPPAVTSSGLTAVFTPDPNLWDGRFANNGWLQELPKPLSKEVWGAALSLAPETAAAQVLKTGDMVEAQAGGRTLRAPVRIAPGQAPDTLGLPLGFGRTAAGRIGSRVGVDVGSLRQAASPWILTNVTLRRVDEAARVIATQHHHAMEGRDIVRVVAPNAPLEERAPQPSLHDAFAYDGAAWGMTIDLDACIGCNACVVACQAENNIAIVGPDEVAMGREMHWLRIDRYYEGEPAAPRTYFQPVPCMQCEKAPCEIVCPVNATVHSSEGLNDMVYNRCVGTRTCSNNCPYKVRRFNWHDATRGDFKQHPESANPAVTVRSRGVMEKCTYCVQRISAARMAAGQEDRAIADGDVVTACQQSCPTQAIAFGDLNKPDSAVARLKKNPRNYALLGELNTRPRTTYLARVAGLALTATMREPQP